MKWLVGVALVLCISAPAGAASPNADDKRGASQAAGPVDPLGRDTPYGAVMEFLRAAAGGDWARAAAYLDLEQLPSSRRTRAGTDLARQLKQVLDHGGWINRQLLSREAEGNVTDELGPGRDRIGLVRLRRGSVDLVVGRTTEAEVGAIWRFAPETVAQIPAMARELGANPLEARLPESLVRWRMLDVAAWQWIALVLLVPAAFLVASLLVRLLFMAAQVVPRTRTEPWQRARAVATAPVRLFVAAALFAAGTWLLGLSIFVRQYIGRAVELIVLFALAWLVVRLIGVLSDAATAHLVDRQRLSGLSAVALGRRVGTVLVVALAVFSGLATLGFNITPVLAALGVGGIAVALAAQKTIENLFGGITLITDQPIRVGDFCRFGDRVGTVEDVGLRSTRVRTLDRTVVSIPNAEFSGMQLENFSRRDRIWLRTTLGLRYETTPDQLRYVLVEIRKMLYAHPKVYRDPARVRFVGFGAYSLDLELFAYARTADFNEFLAIREDIFLRIMEIVATSGTGFAFPSQTVYVRRDAGLDADRSQAAEEQVRAWRARQEMCLPEFPPERIEALTETLDYPPTGAATTKTG